MPAKQLSAADCEQVELCAYEKTNEYGKQNDILGEQIFDILKQNCRVLLYPLEDDDVWGFYEKTGGSSFVCINTSIDYDKQVFVAAHELYHLWFNHPEELILANDIEERGLNPTIEELKANRFAAAFLVPEYLLLREMNAGKTAPSKIDVPDILRMARLFLVPYRTMVKRLHELGKINAQKRDAFLAVSEDVIAILRKRHGLELVKRTNDIDLDVLIDKAISAFERNLITREKLEYLLSLARTTPDELGIQLEVERRPPSDEDLTAIMEE